jgi:hypothetical protein
MMTIQRIMTTMAEWIPQSIKDRTARPAESPNRLANAIHLILNCAPGEKYPVLDCSGVLEGYRMRVDWTKLRGFAYGTWEPEVAEDGENARRLGRSARDRALRGVSIASTVFKHIRLYWKIYDAGSEPINGARESADNSRRDDRASN